MKKFLSILLAVLCLLGASPVLRAADISITAANVLASAAATKTTGSAGATITAGQVVYLDPVTTTYKLADANGASPLYKVAGIALNNASSGQPLTIATADASFTIGGTVAAGDIVVLSATPGAMCVVNTSTPQPTTGWFVTVLGVGIGTNKIMLKLNGPSAVVP